MAGVRVLVPVDGSEATYRALEAGLPRLATANATNITLLAVMDKAIRSMPKEAREHLEYDDEDEIFIRDDEVKAVLDKAEALAKKLKGAKIARKVVEGNVFDAVVEASKGHDVLLMHGMRRDESVDRQHRSLVERIARGAYCDVLLVREGAAD